MTWTYVAIVCIACSDPAPLVVPGFDSQANCEAFATDLRAKFPVLKGVEANPKFFARCVRSDYGMNYPTTAGNGK